MKSMSSSREVTPSNLRCNQLEQRWKLLLIAASGRGRGEWRFGETVCLWALQEAVHQDWDPEEAHKNTHEGKGVQVLVLHKDLRQKGCSQRSREKPHWRETIPGIKANNFVTIKPAFILMTLYSNLTDVFNNSSATPVTKSLPEALFCCVTWGSRP